MVRYWMIAAVVLLSLTAAQALAQFSQSDLQAQINAATGGSGSTAGQTGTSQAAATGGQTGATQSGGGASGATNTASSQQVLAGSDRFLQRNQNPGQVIGANRAGVGNVLGTDQTTGQTGTNRGQQSQNRFGAASGFGAFGNQFGGNSLDSLYAYGALNSIANRRAQLRMPVQLDRHLTMAGVVAPQTRVSNITSRMSRIPRLQQMGSMTVAMEGRTAIVRGSVATAEDRELVAKMLLLEPGVGDVKNELAVLSPEPADFDLSDPVPPPPLAQPPLPPAPVLPTE